MSKKITVSFHADDVGASAARLKERLAAQLGQEALVWGVENLVEIGDDWYEVITQKTAESAALVVVIGPQWLTIERNGQSWLQDTDDYDQLALTTALANSGVKVIPVLLDGASMPTAAQLPEGLQSLARRGRVELSEENFETTIQSLVDTLQKALPSKALQVSQPVASPPPAAPSVSTPPPAPTTSFAPPSAAPSYASNFSQQAPSSVQPQYYSPPPQKSANYGWVVLLVLLLGAVGVYWVVSNSSDNKDDNSSSVARSFSSGNSQPARVPPTVTPTPKWNPVETVYVNGGTGTLSCTSHYTMSGYSYRITVSGRFRYDYDYSGSASYANGARRKDNSGNIESHYMLYINSKTWIYNELYMSDPYVVQSSDRVVYLWSGDGARLCFYINDNNYNDNDGSLTVTLERWY